MLTFLFLAALGQGATSVAPSIPQESPRSTPSAPAGWSTFWWGDYDADGLADAWVVGEGGRGRLLRNAGDGAFVDATTGAGLERVAQAYMALWADYDRDRRLDLFLPAWNGTSQLLRQTAPGAFQDVTSEAGLGESSFVVDAEWLDYDADGALDLRLTTWGEEVLLHNGGAGLFERVVLDLPAGLSLGAGYPPPASPDEARLRLSLAPIQHDGADEALSAVSASGAASSSSIVTQPFCLTSIEDASNPGVDACIQANSIPTLGQLYPLSSTFFIEGGTGDVGVGTTAPAARLDVVGGDVRTSGRFESLATSGSPLVVNSATVVANLNADRLDGFEAAAFSQFGAAVDTSELAPNAVTSGRVLDETLTADDLAPNSVGTAEIAAGAVSTADIAAGAITNAHVAAAAAIAGTKITPSFGAQDVTSTGDARFGSGTSADPSAVRGESADGPTRGYLGVLGAVNYDGVLSADWAGQEIGVAGISTGVGVADNYGVVGHATEAGVRGEFADAPALNYGELGRDGTGLYATGATFAAELDGVLSVQATTSGNPAVDVVQSGTSRAASFVQENAAGLAAVFASSVSTNPGHRTLYATHSGNSVGGVALFESTDPANIATNTWISHAGVSEALLVTTANAIRSVTLDRSTVHASGNDMLEIDVPAGSAADSQFVEYERGGDVEFRVDGDGDVFADGAYTGPADFAEMIAVTTGAPSVRAGDVLVIDPGASRSVRAAEQAYSTLVAGVYSTAPGFVGSERSFVDDSTTGEKVALKRADMARLYGEVPMAMVGIVPCNVSVENGPIFPGDLLVTSNTRGHAMRDANPPVGTVIGKALETFDGTGAPLGTIKVLVTLQ